MFRELKYLSLKTSSSKEYSKEFSKGIHAKLN